MVTPIVDRIVYASTAYVDLKSTINQQAGQLVDMSRSPAGPADERLMRAASLLRPVVVPDRSTVRVGGPGDGGYVMLDDDLPRYALSIGVGPDVSWDADVARRGVRVAMFDPTVRRLPAPVPGGRFFRVGLAAGPTVSATYRPLADLLTLSGFPPRGEMLLKVDVEGAEWGAIASLDPADLVPYRQICLELHDLHRLAEPARATDVLRSLEILRDGHLPIHVHANNYARLIRFEDLWFPDAIEVTYVRRDRASGAQPATQVASPLDVANDPRVSDVDLKGLLGAPVLPE